MTYTNMKFRRLKGEGFDEYEVTIVGGSIPDDAKEKDVGVIIILSDTKPKRCDIIIDDDERLAVVWTDASEMNNAYLVQYAFWPIDWKKWLPRNTDPA